MCCVYACVCINTVIIYVCNMYVFKFCIHIYVLMCLNNFVCFCVFINCACLNLGFYFFSLTGIKDIDIPSYLIKVWHNTLLKTDVTRRDHVVRCHGSHECWFTHRQFHSQFHSRWHSLCITLKSTTLVCMRSSNAWTTKSWQRSEWRLGFNSV